MSEDITSRVSSYETTERPLRDAEGVCCVLLGSGRDGAWHSEANRRNLGLSPHTLPRLAGNGLARPRVFSNESQRGTRHRHVRSQKGLFPLEQKNIVTAFYFVMTVLLVSGERRMRREEEEEEQERPADPPVVIWQVMRGGALLIYPHREKTSC